MSKVYFCNDRTGRYFVEGKEIIYNVAICHPELIVEKVTTLQEIPSSASIIPPSIPIILDWAFSSGYSHKNVARWAFICNGAHCSGIAPSIFKDHFTAEIFSIYMTLSFAIFAKVQQLTLVTNSQTAISELSSENVNSEITSHSALIDLIKKQLRQIDVLFYCASDCPDIYWNRKVMKLARK